MNQMLEEGNVKGQNNVSVCMKRYMHVNKAMSMSAKAELFSAPYFLPTPAVKLEL